MRRLTPRELLDRAMTERELQNAVVRLAKLKGWKVAHIRDSRGSDAVGLPDLVLARLGEVKLVELKTERGKTTPEQEAWLEASDGVLWRPSDWSKGVVEVVLS